MLDINSPGGTVAGTPELATRIAAAAQRKPVLAVANLQMASAAYWVASQASQVIASPSAEIGSIGVLAIHQETSQADSQAGITTTVFRSVAAKADANGVEPLTEAARAAIETRIAETHQQFLAAVASGRRTTPEAVAQQFGQGRTLTAEQALAVGMIDRNPTGSWTGAKRTDLNNLCVNAVGMYDAYLDPSDVDARFDDYTSALFADGVHPSDAGHAILASAIETQIRALL